MPTIYSAALYLRLSRDDNDDKEDKVEKNESASIQAQRIMLTNYANQHGFHIYDYYVDDGYSGTTFDRPDFGRMLADIDIGKVNLVIVKDLSRLGRDYIATGQYTELIFPAKGVRCIAINDGYDSNNADNDILPFRNVINEMYARDTSRKIRSALATRRKEGLFIGNFAPYGYKKDPNDKNHLIPDENTAPVVQQIFSMAAQGVRFAEIAQSLNAQGIIPPILYRCSSHDISINSYNVTRLEWTAEGLYKLCRNIVYLGHTAQGKTLKVSFKSKVQKSVDRSDWVIVQNTHEPLIDQSTFNAVQHLSRARTCVKDAKGFSNVFSGLAFCADCGKRMSTVGSRKKGSPYNLACGGYKLRGASKCTNHFIEYKKLYQLILNAINEQIILTQSDRNVIMDELQKANSEASVIADKEKKLKEHKAYKRRMSELDKLIEKLYEDKVTGVISEARFSKLLERFETESAALRKKINQLDDGGKEQSKTSRNEFEKLICQYDKIDELSPELLFNIIERIEVGQGYYEKTENGKIKNQDIRIFFRFHTRPEIKSYIM